jgi:cold shock protein
MGLKLQNGTVKSWDSGKGFGFITTDDGDDLFVHSSDLHITIKTKRLMEGQQVMFDTRRDMKGDKAINVRLVK